MLLIIVVLIFIIWRSILVTLIVHHKVLLFILMVLTVHHKVLHVFALPVHHKVLLILVLPVHHKVLCIGTHCSSQSASIYPILGPLLECILLSSFLIGNICSIAELSILALFAILVFPRGPA